MAQRQQPRRFDNLGQGDAWSKGRRRRPSPIRVRRLRMEVLEPRRLLAPGDLDLTFGGDGTVTTDLPYYAALDDVAQSVQSKAGIVVAGHSLIGGKHDFTVVRYHTDGALDGSLGHRGTLAADFGQSDDFASAVVLQSDGKIVVAGSSISGGGSGDFALVRFRVNGNWDTSFDGDGQLTTDFGGANDRAYSITLQSDGKIVVAGCSHDGSDNDFALARYNTDGSLDSSFGGDGKETTDFGASSDVGYRVAVQSDGKIVVAGYSVRGGDADFALARYHVDGSLDTSFGVDGKLTTALGPADDIAYSLAIQGDGKFVVAGSSDDGNTLDFALVRYHADGSLDTSFDGDGKVIAAIGESTDVARGLALQGDGKIVVAGYSLIGGDGDFALARFNPDGSLDASFHGDGKVTTDVSGADDRGFGLALDPSNKIVVAGYSVVGGYPEFAVARYIASTEPNDIFLTAASVAENQPAGTVVGTLTTTDPDLPGDAHTYTLVAGDGSADNDSFTIEGSQLKTAAVLDYETKNLYSIRIRTTDLSGLWYEEAFAINVADLDLLPVGADPVWPGRVIAGEEMAFRVTLTNPESSGVTLDTNSQFQLPGIGYAAVLAAPTEIPAGGQTTLVFRLETIPADALGTQLPRLALSGVDSEGRAYSYMLDLSSEPVSVEPDGTGLAEMVSIPFHPQKAGTVYDGYPVDFYVQNTSGEPIVLDTSTRIEFFDAAGGWAASTLTSVVTIDANGTSNLLFGVVEFPKLTLGDHSPVLICFGTIGGAPYAQRVPLEAVVHVNQYGDGSIGASPGIQTLTVSWTGGTPVQYAGAGFGFSTEILTFDWTDLGDWALVDFRRDPLNDLWIEDGDRTARMWYEPGRFAFPFSLASGPSAAIGRTYSDRMLRVWKTPPNASGGIGVVAGIGVRFHVTFVDEVDLRVDEIVPSSSHLVNGGPIEIAVAVTNSGVAATFDQNGADPSRLVFTDSQGNDISGHFQTRLLNNPEFPANRTAWVRYEVTPTRAFGLGETVTVDARVNAAGPTNVYEGTTPDHRVNLRGYVASSLQDPPLVAQLAGAVVQAGPDAQLLAGETYAAVGWCADPAPYAWTATVDYGDGSAPQALEVRPDLTVELNHPYLEPGRYHVTILVDDGHGLNGTDEVLVDVFGSVIYVDANAVGEQSGVTWADAFTRLQTAIDAARPGQEIWVADGLYPGRMALRSGVSVYGGFAGVETDRSQRELPATPPSIIDAGVDAEHLALPTTLDGFTIRNVQWRGDGGGIRCVDSKLTISNNVIVGDPADESGGVWISASTDVVIEDNEITGHGNSGIALINSTATIRGNRIVGNIGWTGGGIHVWTCPDVLIEDNVVADNSGRVGGALALHESSGLIRGNRMERNTAGEGGAICVRSSVNVRIEDNTIQNNSSGAGGGIWLPGCSHITVARNQILDNSTGGGGGGILAEGSDIVVADNQIQGNSAGSLGGGIYAEGLHTIVADNQIQGNWADGAGGGIYLSSSSTDVLRNDIADNVSLDHGGGLFVWDATAVLIEGNLIERNAASKTGALIVGYHSEATIVRNVICENTTSQPDSNDWRAGVRVAW